MWFVYLLKLLILLQSQFLLIDAIDEPFRRIQDLPYEVSEQANALVDFSIFLTGGCGTEQFCLTNISSICFCKSILTKFIRYDIVNDRYDIISEELPRPRYRHTSEVVVVNGVRKLVLLGGRNGSDHVIKEVDSYVFGEDRWESGGIWEDAGSNMGSVMFANQIYLAGGYFQNYSLIPNVLVYNPLTELISIYDQLRWPRGDAAVVYLPPQFLYIVGGRAAGKDLDGDLNCQVNGDIWISMTYQIKGGGK